MQVITPVPPYTCWLLAEALIISGWFGALGIIGGGGEAKDVGMVTGGLWIGILVADIGFRLTKFPGLIKRGPFLPEACGCNCCDCPEME